MSTSFLSLQTAKPCTTIFSNTSSSSVSTTPPKQPYCSLPTIPSYMTPSEIVKNMVRPL